ncbi:hypothetical protein LTR86_004560 [Recurvomyces mirabilis]|nr:hypothetical protein LTR86_004560 [Recurvomyces mirabilis]
MSVRESSRGAHPPPSACQLLPSFSKIDRQELEATDWLIVENKDQYQESDSMTSDQVEASVRHDNATTISEPLGTTEATTTFCRPQGCSNVASWTVLRAARARSRSERARLHECYCVQQRNVERYTKRAIDGTLVAELLHGLRQQLSTDSAVVEEQAAVVEATEEAVCKLEAQLYEDETSEAAGVVWGSVVESNSCRTPPLVESYLRRCGDASIARERLAELAHEANNSVVGHGRGHSTMNPHESYVWAESTRREELEMDLRCALGDIEALEAACVASNLDPDISRFR